MDVETAKGYRWSRSSNRRDSVRSRRAWSFSTGAFRTARLTELSRDSLRSPRSFFALWLSAICNSYFDPPFSVQRDRSASIRNDAPDCCTRYRKSFHPKLSVYFFQQRSRSFSASKRSRFDSIDTSVNFVLNSYDFFVAQLQQLAII